jgi:hypothetical protein
MSKEPEKVKVTDRMDKVGNTTFIHSDGEPRSRILIGTATLGIIRMEWSSVRNGMLIPCNWESGKLDVGIPSCVPMKYLTADAQNLIIQHAILNKFEWVLLWEDDVIPPVDLYPKLNQYIRDSDTPIVSGLYYTKSNPSEPLVYREMGKSFYGSWKMGDLVWAGGVPTGMLLIHHTIFELMYEESPQYQIFTGQITRKVFESPRNVWIDPEQNYYKSSMGTSDLYWCDRVKKENVLRRAGWSDIAKKKYPFLVDTNIFCKHIDLHTGVQYPEAKPEKKDDNKGRTGDRSTGGKK